MLNERILITREMKGADIMCKRVMIGLFAMSVVAMWWTEADAKTCQQWRYSGGSKVCTKWSTKGVMLGVGLDGYACGIGQACKVTAIAVAKANKSFAFCKKGNKIRRVKLHVPLHFVGSAACDLGDDGSDDVSDHVSDDVSDDVSDTVCRATIVLLQSPPVCQIACTGVGEICVDATPFAMNTSVDACIGEDCKGKGIDPALPVCSEKSPICTTKEQCTINPNKVAYNEVKRFYCEQR